MSPHLTNGLSPDRGIAPAYRLAPDTPAEISADLARLCAGSGQNVSATGDSLSAEPARLRDANGLLRCHEGNDALHGYDDHRAPRSTGRRLALFGGAVALLAPLAPRSVAARVAESDVTLIGLGVDLDRTLDGAAFAFDPVADEDDQDRRIARANALQLEIAALAGLFLMSTQVRELQELNRHSTALRIALDHVSDRELGGRA